MASIRVRTHADGSKSYQVRGDGIQTETFTRAGDAKVYRADQERRAHLGDLHTEPSLATGEFLDGYRERKAATRWRASTERVNREAASYLEPLREIPLAKLRRGDIEDILTGVASHAPRQSQQARQLLFAALRDARLRGHRVDEGIFSIARVRYEERQPRFLTLAELDRLESWFPEYIRRIIRLAGIIGMRQGELFALRDSDLHLDEGYLQVERGKTKAARRRVQLPDDLQRLLKEQLLARPAAPAGAHSRDGDPDPSRLVFPTLKGLRWQRNNFMERLFRPAAVAAGLGTSTVTLENGQRRTHYDGIRFHDLRHTAVSLAALAGVPLEDIARRVGWEPASFTAMYARYRHLFDSETETGTAKLNELLRAHTDAAQDAHG